MVEPVICLGRDFPVTGNGPAVLHFPPRVLSNLGWCTGDVTRVSSIGALCALSGRIWNIATIYTDRLCNLDINGADSSLELGLYHRFGWAV